MASCIFKEELFKWLKKAQNASKILPTKHRKFRIQYLEKVVQKLYQDLGNKEGYGSWVDSMLLRNITTGQNNNGTGLLNVNSDDYVVLNAFCLKLGVRLIIDKFDSGENNQVYVPCDKGKNSLHKKKCLVKKVNRVTYYQMLNPQEFPISYTFAHIKGKVYVIHNTEEYENLSRRHYSYETLLSKNEAEQILSNQFKIPNIAGDLCEIYKNPSVNPIATSNEQKKLILVATDCFLSYANDKRQISTHALHLLGKSLYC